MSPDNDVEEKYPGIFYLTGRIQFETQIIVFSRLDETHPAYRILRPGATEKDVERFLQEAQLASEPWEKADIKALLEVSVASNKELYRKLRKEKKDMGEAIQELFQEDIDKKIAERDKEKIMAMLRKGKTPEEIADFCDYPLALILEVQKSMMVAV